ncbi:MAG TPA: zinc ABC transporter substrate-binding protein, partial [Acidimicrobiaceae bacterium]|nr:zinc ABC transporter substrate-binding protein [Acidimicrobiaceae bacterium]
EGHDDHDDHDDHEGHDDHDDHDDHEGHDHGGIDPHFFTDPGRMATVVEELNEFLVANFPNADQGFVSTANSYAQDLMDLDAEVEEILSGIPASSRLLVTNHAVFGYFADSYSFEILGEIIPSSSTLASASAQQLSNLAEELRSNNVTAIFADASASDALAQTLAAEVGGIEVITLYTESLGDPGSSGESYIDMVRFNAEAIASGLLQ